MNVEKEIVLSVKNVKKYFPITRGLFSRTKGYVYAVDDVSFEVQKGETLGIVGESGCGKSTLAKTIMRLFEPTDGKIFFCGREITGLSEKDLRPVRTELQIIFQDPYSSLDPRASIRRIVGEGLKSQERWKSTEINERVATILEKVGLRRDCMTRFPHEFSGGQRQRIAIARTLVLSPTLIIGDEPFSALDVSIQAQLINLVKCMQEEFHFSFIVISHDVSLVKYMSNRIGVMYLGRIVELGPSVEICVSPLHPYTSALISAVPIPDPDLKKTRIILEGDVPSPVTPPRGCHFHPRCCKRKKRCEEEPPELRKIGSRHLVACHFV